MSWPETKVESFEDFVHHLSGAMPSTSSGNQLYWFRGQKSSGWPLESSLARCLRTLRISGNAALGVETEALSVFKSQAHLFVRQELLAKVFTTPCWWAVMQHHGAPTRLLDWSRSPYVASYFAVQWSENESPGVVWAFCKNILSQKLAATVGQPPGFDEKTAPVWYDKKLRQLNGKEIIMPLEFSYITSERIVAQQGCFTMCFRVDAGHDCLIGQVLPKYVRKFIIPHKLKPEFLLRLREMNIAGSTLFPGIDGLGQSVRELVDLRAHYPMETVTGSTIHPHATVPPRRTSAKMGTESVNARNGGASDTSS